MSKALVLLLALLGLSFSGPLVRLSHAHPLTIAVWRLAFALAFIAPALAVTGSWRQWRRLSRGEFGLAVLAGALLALHFWSWNASVGLTTIAASVVLVDTQPVIVAALSAAWLREPPSRGQWLGIGVAMLGALLVAWPDLTASGTNPASSRALLGDVLALTGAVTAAVYYTLGRRLRAKLDLWPYVSLVYATCLIVLLGCAWLARAPVLGQPPRELAIFLALAVGPMLLGHTGLNWALKYLPAYAVNVTILGEPVLATLLAASLPGIRELPAAATVGGGLMILGGIALTNSGLLRSSARAEAEQQAAL